MPRYNVYPIIHVGDHYELDFQARLASSNDRSEAAREATTHNANHTLGVAVVDYTTGHAWSPDDKLEQHQRKAPT